MSLFSLHRATCNHLMNVIMQQKKGERPQCQQHIPVTSTVTYCVNVTMLQCHVSTLLELLAQWANAQFSYRNTNAPISQTRANPIAVRTYLIQLCKLNPNGITFIEIMWGKIICGKSVCDHVARLDRPYGTPFVTKIKSLYSGQKSLFSGEISTHLYPRENKNALIYPGK